MAPLQECIAECDVDAPLYTVPTDGSKPMRVRYVCTDGDGDFVVRIEGDVLSLAYHTDGKYCTGLYPDIAPVMPTPGSRWVLKNEKTGTVERSADGTRLLIRIDGSFMGIAVDKWGRAVYPEKDEYSLVLPYVEPKAKPAPDPEPQTHRGKLLRSFSDAEINTEAWRRDGAKEAAVCIDLAKQYAVGPAGARVFGLTVLEDELRSRSFLGGMYWDDVAYSWRMGSWHLDGTHYIDGLSLYESLPL